MVNVAHGFSRTLAGTTFDQARARIEAALKDEGFGVLTEDDVGNAVIAVLDPDALWRMAGSPPGLAEPLHEARARLERALARA